MVVDTVVLIVPYVGDIEVMVEEVALLIVMVPVTVPPSEFRITRFHVPEAIPFRLKFLLRVVELSVPMTAPVTVDCPVFVKVTDEPLKPDPIITIVCEPLFVGLEGEMDVIAGLDAVAVAVKVIGEPDRDPLVAVRVFAPTVAPRVQLPTVATPLLPVGVVKPVALPPPEAPAKVTLVPLTGFPYESFTITLGRVVTAVLIVAD